MATKFQRIQITDENHFKSVVKASDDPRLFIVDVYSAWCGPCNAVVPTLKSLALTLENFVDRCCCVAADAALVPELASLGGSSTPKFLLYKDGVVVEQITGANAPLLKQKIEELAPPLEPGGLTAFS
ncbi:hypothetical protein, conserved [Eimeria acervulina]|uniref:Thioredoxin domain-containing protein n=1 Tax=Eimeria acervulina TaxID=5801 RepID=U6GPD3_EIMAC|nr:hypothetical protein, conserved [Eimeria acervulina]CDI81123.1 hypothetical protein, conserved [Eimeria acervulina]